MPSGAGPTRNEDGFVKPRRAVARVAPSRCAVLLRGAGPSLISPPMSLRTILIHPDPRLKKVCAPVAEITDDLRELAQDMLETMYDAPGVGLAAPQVGVLKRVIVMDCNKLPEDEPRPLVMFNPEIVWESADIVASEEGCLSLPEQFAPVERSAEVRVRWRDTEGTTQEETFDGLWSVCVQHEIDHLDGTLFIDHLGFMKRQMVTRRLAKLMRERARA